MIALLVGIATACTPMMEWTPVSGLCPLGAPTLQLPTPGGHAHHSTSLVNSSHGEVGSLLVVGGMCGAGALLLGGEGGGGVCLM